MAKQKEKGETALYIAGGIGLVVGVFYLFKGKGNPPPPPNTDNIINQAGQSGQKKLVVDGVTATRYPWQWKEKADVIHTALKFSAVDDNKAKAETALKAPVNIADVRSLIIEYGNRQRHWFGFPDGGQENLGETISRELDKKAITRINDFYRSRNINFRW